eukprot:2165181-Heterocapsa_arctica.AAC.1
MLLARGPKYDCKKATAIPHPATMPLVTVPPSAAAPATLTNLGAAYCRQPILASPGGKPSATATRYSAIIRIIS